MNTYLAMVRFTMDDIPILLTNRESEAYRALQLLDAKTLADIQETLGTDASMRVCGAVYYFEQGAVIRVEHDVRLTILEDSELCS